MLLCKNMICYDAIRCDATGLSVFGGFRALVSEAQRFGSLEVGLQHGHLKRDHTKSFQLSPLPKIHRTLGSLGSLSLVLGGF